MQHEPDLKSSKSRIIFWTVLFSLSDIVYCLFMLRGVLLSGRLPRGWGLTSGSLCWSGDWAQPPSLLPSLSLPPPIGLLILQCHEESPRGTLPGHSPSSLLAFSFLNYFTQPFGNQSGNTFYYAPATYVRNISGATIIRSRCVIAEGYFD